MDITSLLRSLCREGLLVSSGFGRGTVYSVNTGFKQFIDKSNNDQAPDDEPTSEPKTLGESVAGKVASNVAGKVASNVASNVASRQRHRRNYYELCHLIKGVCKTWKTRQEIAVALGYKQDYLRNTVLPRMVSDGYIEKLYTESATSPSQKYRATTKKMQKPVD